MIDEKYKENGMEGGFMNGVERIAKERKRQIGEDYEEIRKLKKKAIQNIAPVGRFGAMANVSVTCMSKCMIHMRGCGHTTG